MSFSAYISSIYTLIGLGGLVVACGFAWWKGGAPERLGALMLAVSWIGTDVARGFSNEMIPTVTIFVSDVALAVGFLYIAIRYSSLWLGAMMILEAIEFALHATQLADPSTPRWHGWIIYLLFNNLLNYLLLLTLFGGAWAAIGKRSRLAREKAEAEAKAAARPPSPFRVPPQPPAAAF
jgi:hypothetical protein